MSEKFKLYKNIENFIDAECAYKKNSPFIVSFKKENGKTEPLPKIFDNSNFIQCIMNIPKEKESLLNQGSSEFKVNVTDSSFEFVLYKSNNFPSVIKCLLLLIVNDIEKSNDKEDLKYFQKYLAKVKKCKKKVYVLEYTKDKKLKFK